MPYAPFDLEGKVALVTGGNRGIGFGFAQALYDAGAAVAIWGSNEKNNAEAVKKLGSGAKAWTVNVADEKQVAEAMREVAGHFGRIDSVFANAGIGGGAKSFAEFPTEVYRRVLSVNLDGVFFTLREAAKHMVERANAGDPGGSLVGVASLAAIEGAARTRCRRHQGRGDLDDEIHRRRTRPLWRARELRPPRLDRHRHDARRAGQPRLRGKRSSPRVPATRRWGEPKDSGGVAVYLTSDASSYHSGDSFVIDGGYSIF